MKDCQGACQDKDRQPGDVTHTNSRETGARLEAGTRIGHYVRHLHVRVSCAVAEKTHRKSLHRLPNQRRLVSGSRERFTRILLDQTHMGLCQLFSPPTNGSLTDETQFFFRALATSQQDRLLPSFLRAVFFCAHPLQAVVLNRLSDDLEVWCDA